MSIMSMVNAVKIPYGELGSMFIDPNKQGGVEYNALSANMAEVFGVDPDASAALGEMSSVSTATDEYTTEKLGKLPTELPMMQAVSTASETVQTTINRVDNALDKVVDSATEIANAFPSGEDIESIGCPDINASFKALKEGVESTRNSVKDGIADIYNGVSTAVKDAINQVTGGIIQTGKDFVKFMTEASAAAIATVKGAVASLVATSQEVMAEIKEMANTVKATAMEAVADFKEMVAEELQAVKDAMGFLTGFNFLNMFKSINPCIASIVATATDSAKVDPEALNAKDTPVADLNTPTNNAIAQASTNAPIGPFPGDGSQKVVPPSDIPNPYTTNQLIDMFGLVRQRFTAIQVERTMAAEWVKTNIEDWKVNEQVNYWADQAGATQSNLEGTTTDPTIQAKWKSIQTEYNKRRKQYDETHLKQIRDAVNLHSAYVTEYNRRQAYGRTPYTTLADRGSPVPAAQQTTLLDSGI